MDYNYKFAKIPTAFAEVAGPMQKLWVLYLESSKPALFNVVERKVLNWALVKGKLFSEMNSEPGVLPLIARYGSNTLTGYTTESVFPRHNLTPFHQKGSVFDCLIVCQTRVGQSCSPMLHLLGSRVGGVTVESNLSS